MNRPRALGLLAIALATLGLLARNGSLPPGLTDALAPLGAVATPATAALLTVGTLVGAAAAARGRDGGAAIVAFRGERGPTADLPLLGAEVAAALDRVADTGPGADPADRETVRAGIERAGVRVIARADGIDREVARARLRRGDWTRDPAVAAFCDAEVTAPLGTRVREALAPEPRFVSRARRTVDALGTYADEQFDGSDTDAPGVADGTGGDRR
jgi:hypothetical protein